MRCWVVRLRWRARCEYEIRGSGPVSDLYHRNECGREPEVDAVNTPIDVVERVVHAEVLRKIAGALADATPKRLLRKMKTKEKKDAK